MQFDAKGGQTMFEVTARLKIRDGRLDGFKEQAAEMMRIAKEQDTGTLRYDWFVSDDGTECEVREAYTDADALLEHGMNVAEARDTLFRDYADGHHMTLYAEPSPALAALIEKLAGHVELTQLTFFQGLDSPVREEVLR
jgi:quinol monooxygenase YgiN